MNTFNEMAPALDDDKQQMSKKKTIVWASI